MLLPIRSFYHPIFAKHVRFFSVFIKVLITFKSNDPGLTLTTPNLKGPAGDPGKDGDDFDGNLPECQPKGEKGVMIVGSGLNVDSSATVSVDLDTIELDEQSITYRPLYTTFNDRTFNYEGAFNEQKLSEETVWTEEWQEMNVPAESNGASISWFQSSGAVGNPEKGPPDGGQVNTFLGLFQINLEVQGAAYTTKYFFSNIFRMTRCSIV